MKFYAIQIIYKILEKITKVTYKIIISSAKLHRCLSNRFLKTNVFLMCINITFILSKIHILMKTFF